MLMSHVDVDADPTSAELLAAAVATSWTDLHTVPPSTEMLEGFAMGFVKGFGGAADDTPADAGVDTGPTEVEAIAPDGYDDGWREGCGSGGGGD